jgi:hypothetical protein
MIRLLVGLRALRVKRVDNNRFLNIPLSYKPKGYIDIGIPNKR